MRINKNVIDLCRKSGLEFCKKNGLKDLDLKKVIRPIDKVCPFMKNISPKIGRYKLDSRLCLIDQLSRLTDKAGKPRFNQRAIKRAVMKYTESGKKPIFSSTEEEFERLYSEAVRFAKNEPNATLKDIALFANLRENNWALYNSLPEARKGVFREFLPYMNDLGINALKIDDGARRLSRYTTYTDDGLNSYCVPGVQELLMKASDETIQLYRDLLKIKSPKGPFSMFHKYLFSSLNIYKISLAKDLDKKTFIKLSQTSGIDGHSLSELVHVEGINLRKFSQTINKIKKQNGGEISFFIEHDPYEPNRFILRQWGKKNAKEVLSQTFDNEMNLISTERIVPEKGLKSDNVRLIGKDYEVVQKRQIFQTVRPHQVKEGEIKPIEGTSVPVTISEIRHVKDAQGNIIRTEYMSPSEVEGLHNWTSILPDGTEKPIIQVTKRNGAITIKKDMESLDGVVTKSKFKQLPNGSYAMRLSITDGENVLAKRFVSHRIISDTEAVSTVNGEKFRVFYSPNEIKVTDINGAPKFSINLKIILDYKATPEEKQKLINLLKQCSADELEVVSKKVKLIKFLDIDNGQAVTSKGIIETNGDIFTFKHELGHIEDLTGRVAYPEGFNGNAKGKFSGAKEFQQIHDSERKSFMEAFPTVIRKHLDYFVDMMSRARCQQETAAEQYATKGAVDVSPSISVRTEYIERFMPRTRSFIING